MRPQSPTLAVLCDVTNVVAEFMVRAIQRVYNVNRLEVDSREDKIGSHVCESLKREGVGSSSILECNTLTMNSVAALMTSHNIVGSNSILECNTLTMNSVAALMTPHNIMGSNIILECKFAFRKRAPRHACDTLRVSGLLSCAALRFHRVLACRSHPFYNVLQR
jgi:hypothetical protein